MIRYAELVAPALFAGLPVSSGAAKFSYSYLALTADVSKTENTATAPLDEDADGRLLGITASWDVSDSFYLKGAWSRETKEFANVVSRTPVDLDSEQTVIALGVGYRLDPGQTDQPPRGGPRNRRLLGRAPDPARCSLPVRAAVRGDGRLHHRWQRLERGGRRASLRWREARARRPALTHPYTRGCRAPSPGRRSRGGGGPDPLARRCCARCWFAGGRGARWCARGRGGQA